MAKELDEASKYILRLSAITANATKPLSVAELEKNITQARFYLDYLHSKDPTDPQIAGLQDLLLLLQTSRGKGIVM